MKAEKINRSVLLQVRLTPRESKRINDKFSHSTSRNLSDFIRKIILDKPITIRQRNQSLDDFMQEMILLRNELSAIGNNFNQSVKRLHTLEHPDSIKNWIQHTESTRQMLLKKTDEIKSKINSISDQWLQS